MAKVKLIPPEPLAFSVPDAADSADISKAQLHILIGRGEGPKITKLGRRTVILAEDLRDWLREQRDLSNTPEAILARKEEAIAQSKKRRQSRERKKNANQGAEAA